FPTAGLKQALETCGRPTGTVGWPCQNRRERPVIRECLGMPAGLPQLSWAQNACGNPPGLNRLPVAVGPRSGTTASRGCPLGTPSHPAANPIMATSSDRRRSTTVGRGLLTSPLFPTAGLKQALETCSRLNGTVGRPC